MTRIAVLRQPRLATLALLMAALLSLCGVSGCVYRVDIQQGNFLDPEDVERVSVGMTRLQVRSLLGTPMVADPFQPARWDYMYYLKRGRWSKPEERHFVVYFDEQDKVARIDRRDATSSTKQAAATKE